MADTPQQVDIFRTSPLHFLRGPEQSEGVVVYGHGYGGPDADGRSSRAPGWLSGFNDAGWDILRYDRHPAEDELYNTLPRLIRAVPRLRALGYRRIVLAGGSRGGWQSLLAAGEASGVDTVLAIAPAAHGRSGAGHSAVLDDWQRGLGALPSKQVRVAAVLFDDDRFDPDPERRASMLMANGLQRGVPVLALRPQQPVRGHSGDALWQFTHDYTQCLVSFVMDASPPSAIRRLPCGTESNPAVSP
ncbi:alpha/beta hydrolase family protein [Roseomonas haemaphysalidis]|uniref:Alpha/beta hydrolase n=1 Tax=Roseomonas haemaphysalidis TaxID=2768162 RepID=A0ABS3KW83_9PROT|nr:alpha/beta hydrolase [Roseomonas haemaphysalidis]MBO1081742.1 alpha/beta hydrolase [Roseomonas haemaphysalidis]